MTRTEAESYIKADLPGYLAAHGIDTARPFRCLNPEHTDKSPSMRYDKARNKVHCFGCLADYSTIDLIGIEYGLTDTKAIYNKAFEVYGLEPATDPNRLKLDAESRKKAKTAEGHTIPLYSGELTQTGKISIAAPAQVPAAEVEPEPEPLFDFTGPALAAHEALLADPAALEHFTGRGLTLETIKKYKLGYSAAGYNAMLKAYPDKQTKSYKQNLYNFVFPYEDQPGKYNYFVAEISDRAQIDDYNKKYRKIGGVVSPIFNERYLKYNTPGVLFICEGVYDALSIEQAGGHALAPIGLGHRRLLNLCKQYQPHTVFVLMLDQDGAGQKAQEALKIGLAEQNIPFLVYKQAESINAKDANEFLQLDPEKLEKVVAHIEKRAETMSAAQDQSAATVEPIAEAAQDQPAEDLAPLILKSSLDYMPDFDAVLTHNANYETIKTGFDPLDKELEGGLYEGLYIIGAISSLGKTTFCLQIADNIAKQGRPVLFFSLEMARSELQAKSISRETYSITKKNGTDSKTTRGVLNYKKFIAKNSQEEKNAFNAAVSKYKEYAENLYIYEGKGPDGKRISAKSIRDIVTAFVSQTGKTPVVFIDYLQIMAPLDPRATDKQNVGDAVSELKDISRDFATPVIAISAFNRANYTEPLNMSAFRESSDIEYSSDVLLGLQFSGMEYSETDTGRDGAKKRAMRINQLFKDNETRAKNRQPVVVQVKILKNRNSPRGYVLMDFVAAFNHYEIAFADNTQPVEENFIPIVGPSPFDDVNLDEIPHI